MAAYVVTGAAVVLPTEGGSERYLYRGAPVGDGFTAEGIKHAVSVGLIEKVKAPAVKSAAEKSADAKAEADAKAAAEKAAADAKSSAAEEQNSK
ncbi:hypothetical protein [Cryobacterium psychrophilum]|uniref:Uncharacterized protein n=1 Tax=Cryobacterium psychrophilum TaxID=41988 RepID=A0A4Y8KRA1_9MICO|nr:hypothetical protein [Cryobacterium psychrophilum]TDW31018.1 hypothetical protein EDD25_2806 [Cryobacterium psychrophilum]TFD80872.1 hypothetical protein E3T53_04425 [Cryobacterium psychrophilum]